MTLSHAAICTQVLEQITPHQKEKRHILTLAKKLVESVQEFATEAEVTAEVRVEGSVAKDTWLREEPDIDIFMRVPITLPREAFGTICLDIARKATAGFTQIERYAEHPYLEAFIEKVRVNIVPCYQVKRGEWISATDRTPFHTDYVKPLLDKEKSSHIRLLKQFMKGIGVYGAEIKTGGFSGYLCELLILTYGSFLDLLKSVADWTGKVIIDYHGHYRSRESMVAQIFEEPLVIVDPVDRGRNAAAAVQRERFDEFIAAARSFLETPSQQYFYPQTIKALTRENLLHALETRGSTITFITCGPVEVVPDVLWGQLYKSHRSLRRLLQQNDFPIIRSSVWSDEKDLNVFLFEVESSILPTIKTHMGPPLQKKAECQRFLQKHLGAAHTLSGPRLEAGRWIVEIARKHTTITTLLQEYLHDGGRQIGVGTAIAHTLATSLQILINEEVQTLYSSFPQFAMFLTEFLEGKPRWLHPLKNP